MKKKIYLLKNKMARVQRMYNGVTGVSSEKDFLLNGQVIPVIENLDDKYYEYNQYIKKETRASCTLFTSFGMLSDLFNVQITDKEIININNLSYDAGRTVGEGWRAYKAIDLVREWWNAKHPDKKVISFRIDLGSPDFREAIEKGHSIGVTFRGDREYQEDYHRDNLLDGVKFGRTFGHMTTLRRNKEGINGQCMVKDTSFGNSWNNYGLADVQGLVDAGTYSVNAYIYIPEKQISKDKYQIAFETKTAKHLQMTREQETIARKMRDVGYHGLDEYINDCVSMQTTISVL